MVNIIAADALATTVAMASAAMTLTTITHYILYQHYKACIHRTTALLMHILISWCAHIIVGIFVDIKRNMPLYLFIHNKSAVNYVISIDEIFYVPL